MKNICIIIQFLDMVFGAFNWDFLERIRSLKYKNHLELKLLKEEMFRN